MNDAGTGNAVRSVAVTGAGSGLGREVAIGFADKGYRVFGTARDPQQIQDVQQAARRWPSATRRTTRITRRTSGR
jgi:NADP-dependent 3-hydroxy acid dehydrogenase YdfG